MRPLADSPLTELDLRLTRAPLGLVRPLPSAGGGGGGVAALSISETNRRSGKIQTAMERPGRDLSDKVEKHVTSQVRSITKCLTFPFNVFLPQNAGNKRISIL